MLNLKQIGERVSQNQDNVGIFIPAGIHEDVSLHEVKVKDTPSGTKVFEVSYRKDNKTTYQTEWLHPEDPVERQEKVAAKILCVLKAFFSQETIDKIEVENVLDLAIKAEAALNSVKDATKLRTKFVYVKDKVTIPRYSKFTWIEPMTIPKEESKIQWMANIDRDTPEMTIPIEQPALIAPGTAPAVPAAMSYQGMQTTPSGPF